MEPSKIFLENQDVLENYLEAWDMDNIYANMIAAAQQKDEKKLIKLANEAWWKLPDNGSIRTEGFFVLCDIAEQIFGEGELCEN